MIEAYPKYSVYQLLISAASEKAYMLFHASKLEPYHSNDNDMSPSCHMQELPPMIVDDKEAMDTIMDQRRRGRGYQHHVWWKGYGIGDDSWLPWRELGKCEALDIWEAQQS